MEQVDCFSNGLIVTVRPDHGADIKAPADRLGLLLSIQRALAAAIAETADDVADELAERLE